ncbi:MAG: rRNA maturation RNase YbeY [Patescibacteria group bacterium]
MTRIFPNLSITNTTKGKLPSLPFLAMKESVLGKDYELSVVFVGSAKSRALNLLYRKKDKPANVLSFALSKKSGEIFLDVKEIFKSKNDYGVVGDKLVGLYFIHGLLHLKGYQHGSTMERTESHLRNKYL